PRGGCSCCRRLLSVACTGPHRHIHSFPTRRSSDLLRDEPLDLFVLFSSLSATLGNAGQADYCAAGAFQDGYAILRERLREHGARSGRTLSIGWPYWSDGGMAVHGENLRLLREELGVVPLRGEPDCSALE